MKSHQKLIVIVSSSSKKFQRENMSPTKGNPIVGVTKDQHNLS